MEIIIAGVVITLAGYLIQIVNLAYTNVIDLFDNFSGVMLRHALGTGIMYTGMAIFALGIVLEIF